MQTKQHKVGVLLVNLGTPSEPTPKAVRKYLAEFLDDPRVVTLPNLMRKLLLYGLILPIRSKKTSRAYQQIWDKQNGSPLRFHSEQLAADLQTSLGENYIVNLAMRYGKPNIADAISSIKASSVDKILVFPLFPQYSAAVTGSIIARALQDFSKDWDQSFIEVWQSYYAHPEYIKALGESLRPHLRTLEFDKLLFSYHGLPLDQIAKSEKNLSAACVEGKPCPVVNPDNKNCYRAHCYTTSRLVAKELAIPEEEYDVCFQSRFGYKPWIKPDLTGKLHEYIAEGKTRLAVACPSFVTDCLETLEEIEIRAKHDWLKLGGKSFKLLPCLNAQPVWVHAITKMIQSANVLSS